MEPAANYDCEILYTEPGKENVVADALSRIHIAPLSSLPNSDSKGSDANQLSEIGFYFVAGLEPCWAKHGRALCSWRKFCVSLVPCFRARNTEHGMFVFRVRILLKKNCLNTARFVLCWSLSEHGTQWARAVSSLCSIV
jgi:hypothetical protein